MRLIEISLLALALNVAGVTMASAAPPEHSNARALRAPELEGKVLPAALVLLVGATALVISRRRRKGEKA